MVWDPRLFAFVKVLHVTLAAAWVGGGALMYFVIRPLVDETTPPTRREVMGRLSPAVIKYTNILGGLTFLTGLALLDGALPRRGLTWATLTDDPWGRLIAFGLILNLLALYLLNFSVRSSWRGIQKIQQEVGTTGDPPAALLFLVKRLGFTTTLLFFLVVIALVAMVAANSLY